MRNAKQKLGFKGEHFTALHYKKKGFRILGRNYNNKLGEIDIIAKKGDLLVFCEVKTRLNPKFGKPFEAVTIEKQKRLKRLAEAFIKHLKVDYKEIRFDVVSILLIDGKPQVEHIENAF